MNRLREEARHGLRVYMSRSGLSLSAIADEVGYSWHSLRQFNSDARYGDGDGHLTAKAVLDWMNSHPIPALKLPGKLHETRATRDMDAMLEHIKSDGWGILYGPSGAQKTFLLEYRFAESAQDPEPALLYIRSSPSGMTPNVLLKRIAAGIGAPYQQSTEGIRQSVLFAIRRRRRSLALVIDEADGLYRWVETLETLREIGDLAQPSVGVAGVGILVVGNEPVTKLFANRRGISFEKWRSRIEQQELRVLGPSAEEAAGILAEELGELKEKTVQAIVSGCMVSDPVTRKEYVNVRRLFNSIRDFKAKRGGHTKARVN